MQAVPDRLPSHACFCLPLQLVWSSASACSCRIALPQVDLVTGEGLQEVFSQGPIHAVINCAAISLPGACEKDPGAARVVNVPTALLASLKKQQEQCGVRALLIHLSTDQVYDGRWVQMLR